jgi:DNA-binding MarR family transcriptional regulator
LAERTDAETTRILLDLSRLLRNLTRLVGGADDGPPMTATQRIALVELGDGGAMRLSDLAAQMGVSAPTASRSVDTLVDLGLADRAPDPSDRRAVRIDLTPAGRELLRERQEKAQVAFAPAVAVLSESERHELSQLLQRMTGALRAH